MVKIISFDMDGTLVQSGFADAVWLKGIPEVYAHHHKVSIDEAKTFIFKEYDEIGEQNVAWYDLQYWIDRYQLPISSEKLLHRFTNLIKLHDDVIEVLDALSASHDLIICSNAMHDFISVQLKHTNIYSYFSKIFSSSADYHLVKKDPAFYQMVCQSLDISPRDLIHIGDHPNYDFQSPRSIGISAYYLDRNESSSENFIVKNLKEFYNDIQKS